ncbi:TadE family protein [Microbacterium sp.]|uniref:TadE family protein n=1 Tax=Microbacterium sp. TaxID=51671 RepID=UPI00261B6DFB|nr:TadE family protein [Microbacterium sp.]
MRRWNRWASNDDGSAALEFITVGVILLVPLVYLVITLGVVQEQFLGVEAAARHSARVVAQAESADDAAARSDAVITNVIDEYGMDSSRVDVAMSCSPTGGACPAAGSTVLVTVSTVVSLPLVPPIFGLDAAASIPLQAAAAQKVSRTWGAD